MPATAAIFPAHDPVGPAGRALSAHQVALIVDVIAPDAADVDAHGVRRDALDALAGVGLLGTALDPDLQRETTELLAGSDASTWFCWAQHQTPMRILEGAAPGLLSAAPESLMADYLPGMRSGALLAAVAFAHVRRPGAPNPVATRVPGGWRFDGRLDWVTSWDIADVVMVMAQGDGADAGTLVCAYLPAGRSAHVVSGVNVGEPLELLAMSGTHTRPIELEGVVVADERIGALLDRSTWLAADAIRTGDANPAAFGVARAAIAELDRLASDRDDDVMRAAADALLAECRSVRSTAYGLVDSDGDPAERLDVRAASLDLVSRATRAVVIARAGSAMLRGTSAERRVREAMFLLVQAQTAPARSASLAREARTATASL